MDPFDLERFVNAQAGVIGAVMDELLDGRKRTHWMWFVFPQLRGLGRSTMAHTFGLGSLDEARAYLAHPVLGPRLIACTEAVLVRPGGSLREIFGSPDDLKFQSSMTLFALAAGDGDGLFRQALQRYCDGRSDDRTVALLFVDR